MTSSQPPDETSSQQVTDLFNSVELTEGMGIEEFKHFLDLFPIAVVVAKRIGDDHRIVYANKAAETLTGHSSADFLKDNWTILAGYKEEAEPHVTLQQAVCQAGEEYHGTFHKEAPNELIVEAYAGVIENEDTSENYRIVALIDVTARERAERQEFARQLRDKDMLLKELQHRVKNNLQLITALIRLDARNQRNGSQINLDRLAGRIESLQLLYRDLSADGVGQMVDLGHYVSQIASAVMHTYAVEGIRLDIKVDYVSVSINVAMPVGLLVNELLTNAFKYAFAGRSNGTLTLRCLCEDGSRIRIVVADDGVGLPEGTTWPIPGKMGTLLVRSLKENANSDFKVESAPETGTRMTIEFAHVVPTAKLN